MNCGADGLTVDGWIRRPSSEQEIDRRVDERIVARGPRKRSGSPLHPGNLAICIPIIAIAGEIGGLTGLIAAFAGLALVFGLAEARR